MDVVTIIFSPVQRLMIAKRGVNILENAREAGVTIRSECGGQGSCGKCRVIAKKKDSMSALTDPEKRHLTQHEIRLGYRLACQAIPQKSAQIVIPKESMTGEHRILACGMEHKTRLDPLIRKSHLKLHGPSLSDTTPDYERLLKELGISGQRRVLTERAILTKLPDILRRAKWDITATIWNDSRIINVEGGDTEHSLYGFAVDIGTSKIAGHLVDLTTGKTVGTHYIANPQLAHGADIITRISFTMKNEKSLRILQRLVLEGINEVIVRVSRKAKVDRQNIYEAVIVGNTAMHHLCLGIQPKYTALSPYVPAIKSSMNVQARELGLRMNRNALIHFLPNIAGFVGSDALGDVLATNFHTLRKTSILIDIGTNTEVFVGNSEDILTCSCASGPAFEGARILHGMKAEVGAIESVSINPDCSVQFKTIDNAKPIGICGSAMIDIVAEMFRQKIIDKRGVFNRQLKTPRLKRIGNQREFVIAYSSETAAKREIVVTQKDIEEIQLAKAAISAGCSILMRMKNLKRQDVHKVFVAGTFGNCINPQNAKFLGLVPDVSANKIEFVGNTALAGARMALISKKARATAEKLSRKIRYIELAIAPDFARELTYAMFIPHRDIERFPSVNKYLTTVSKHKSQHETQ